MTVNGGRVRCPLVELRTSGNFSPGKAHYIMIRSSKNQFTHPQYQFLVVVLFHVSLVHGDFLCEVIASELNVKTTFNKTINHNGNEKVMRIALIIILKMIIIYS